MFVHAETRGFCLSWGLSALVCELPQALRSRDVAVDDLGLHLCAFWLVSGHKEGTVYIVFLNTSF